MGMEVLDEENCPVAFMITVPMKVFVYSLQNTFNDLHHFLPVLK